MNSPIVFVGKHPCDDLPYVEGTIPDPQSDHPMFTFDGPDYSGYYVRLPLWLGRWLARRLRGW